MAPKLGTKVPTAHRVPHFQTKHTDKTAQKATGDKSYPFVAKADSQATLQLVPVRAGWTS